MNRYGNSSGNSGVHSYEINTDSIIVKFSSGETYLYSFRKPGRTHVEKMKILAERGKGLATYINQFVRNNYEAKL